MDRKLFVLQGQLEPIRFVDINFIVEVIAILGVHEIAAIGGGEPLPLGDGERLLEVHLAHFVDVQTALVVQHTACHHVVLADPVQLISFDAALHLPEVLH